MKRLLSVLVAVGISVLCRAQYTWFDASEFPIFGQITQENCDTYHRIPASWLSDSREGLQWLGSNSAGMYVRFRSNSSTLMARWSSKWDTHMNHMTDTGVRGVDLYMLDGKEWRFLGAGRPAEKSPSERPLFWGLTREYHEFMLYLPLYESTTKVEIGVEPGAEVLMPQINSPMSGHQIIMYGTSILQGCSASRPGMAYASIIARKLNREVINLGFSGNALLDPEIARFMATATDPAIFVLDYCPNATAADIKSKGEDFYRILRDAHPDVPIIFIDEILYNGYGYDFALTGSIDAKNKVQAELFNKIKRQGDKNVYHLKASDRPLGDDCEAFVDGTHYTDLGMMRYADYLAPIIAKLMK